jgi:hypothetical protein
VLNMVPNMFMSFVAASCTFLVGRIITTLLSLGLFVNSVKLCTTVFGTPDLKLCLMTTVFMTLMFIVVWLIPPVGGLLTRHFVFPPLKCSPGGQWQAPLLNVEPSGHDRGVFGMHVFPSGPRCCPVGHRIGIGGKHWLLIILFGG